MDKKALNIRPESLSDKVHKLLNDKTINKSQLVNRLLEEEADRRGVKCQ